MKLKLVSFDPALSNMGIAYMTYDIEAEALSLNKLELIQTEASKHKNVRKNSDDLERARKLHHAMVLACRHADLAVAEIPVGTQSARGAMSNGIALGVLAGCPLPLIQVTPTEAKVAAVQCKTATKLEMIEWATAKYPHSDWLTRKVKGKEVLLNDNEHLADAVAIAEAGILTDQFKQAIVFARIQSLGNISHS